MKFAQEMEAKEKIMAQSWMSAATDLDTGGVQSTVNRPSIVSLEVYKVLAINLALYKVLSMDHP